MINEKKTVKSTVKKTNNKKQKDDCTDGISAVEKDIMLNLPCESL